MSELGVNKVILIGRSGGDAALKFTQAGKPVANFSLAVNESFKSRDGEKKDQVEWFNCVCWGKLGKVAGRYVTKGKHLFVEGRLQTRKYDDREGKAREVIVAVPVAAPETLRRIRPLCDDVVCLLAPRHFYAVGQFYEDFRQVEDEEVARLLRSFRPERLRGTSG